MSFEVYAKIKGVKGNCGSTWSPEICDKVLKEFAKPLAKKASKGIFRNYHMKEMTHTEKEAIKAHFRKEIKPVCVEMMREFEMNEAKYGPPPEKGKRLRTEMGTQKYEARRKRQLVEHMPAKAVEARRESKRLARELRRKREIAEAAAALYAAAAAFEAIDEPEAAAKLKAHVRDVTSKFQAAEAELKTAIVTQQIAEAVCLAKAAWEAHVAEWGVEEQGPPHILVNACYSSHTDDDQALRTEAYRPFHRIGEKVSLKIVKLIVTNNGFIANAVEKEVQSVLKADPRADNTFQRDDGGYRKGAGMGPVWGTFWETEFLKPYMMLGLNEKEALRMVYMIKYTLPGQGVALGMAKKTTTN